MLARADVKRAHRFVVAAKKLASLPSHRNVVELLGVSIDKSKWILNLKLVMF